MNKPKLIGILGCDFCGSTAVNAMFNCLPDLLAVGESHWLRDCAWTCNRCKNVPCAEHSSCPNCDEINRCVEHRDCKACDYLRCISHNGCRECGADPCPVFTRDLIDRLRQLEDPKDSWWSMIAEEAKVNVIVSSDKKPHHYDTFGTPDFILILSKDVREHVFSYVKRRGTPISTDGGMRFSDNDVEVQIDRMTKDYNRMLKWARQQERPIKVGALEKIMEHPAQEMRAICQWCDIPFEDSDFDYFAVSQHYVGGNFSLKHHPQYREKHTNTRWKDALSETQVQMILASPRLQKVAETLSKFDEDAGRNFLPIDQMAD